MRSNEKTVLCVQPTNQLTHSPSASVPASSLPTETNQSSSSEPISSPSMIPPKPSTSVPASSQSTETNQSSSSEPISSPSMIPPKPSPIIYPVVGTSLYDSTFPNQLGYTSFLKQVTSDISLPFIVNVDAYQLDHSLEFIIVVNTMHLSNYQAMQHTNYTLRFQDKEYSNQFDRKNTDVGYSVLRFLVPVTTPFARNEQIAFTLIDTRKKFTYNLIAYVRYRNPSPLPIGVCAYVSDYNSIEELRMWVAFYRVQKVSLVVFYVTVPMPELEREFRDLIQTGFLQLVDFTWPRKPVFGHIQYSNQQAQINSCFYHFKYEVKMMILCDTDEFVFSEKFPSDLPKMASFLETEYPNNDVFHVGVGSGFDEDARKPILEQRE